VRLRLLRGWLLGMVVLLTAACGRSTPMPSVTPSEITPSPSYSPTPAEPTPTPIARIPTPAHTVTASAPLPTPAERPLAVVFPTPGPTPETPWRPPMYPVPWAPTPHDHFFLSRPIPAFYGALPVIDYRYGGVFFANEVHTGIDIPGEPGTPVLAAGDGQVIWAGYGLNSGRPGEPGPYGLAVMIRHNFGWQGQTLYTVYAHLSEVAVKPGQWVQAGAPVGRMGNTGHTTGPHLHFEVRLGALNDKGNVVFETYNPELWLVPPVGWGLIVGQVLDTWGQPLSHNIVYLVSLEDEDFHWRTYTYARSRLIHSDPYYHENYVFGDLPAGRYHVTVDYYGSFYTQELEVKPGQVTFFRFKGRSGFEANAQP